MQNFAKITDLAKYTDLSPEGIAKIFKDIGENPEKLRAVLNLWFVPRFKPSFVPAQDYAVAGLQDVEFLGTWDAPPAQLPYRMFDIATGNLVELPSIGVLGQYCMLSHRWKGDELNLAFIKEALKEANAAGAGVSGTSSGARSDVQLVLDKCRLDILEQERTIIRELSGIDQDEFIVRKYLKKRLEAKAVKKGLEDAKREEAQKWSKLKFAEMEQKIFSNLINQMNKKVDGTMGHVSPIAQGSTGAAPSTKSITANGHNTAEGVIKEAETAVKNAKEKLSKAKAKAEKIEIDVEFFNKNSRLREAIDKMISRLQRWKSAIKLDKSIVQAREIFKTSLFQKQEKQYLWLDTCCIDKQNGGELSQSLSLMGDWYANAEFCLVQLDTKYAEIDAIDDWDRFEKERGKDLPHPEKLIRPDPEKSIRSFEEIKPEPGKKNPEWSERSWTLQELVMSKVTYYANSEWKQLSRPVESLGYYYYLVPFIELYGCGDTKNIYSTSLKTPLDGDTKSTYSTSLMTLLRSWVSRTLPKILEGYNIPKKYKELEEHIESLHTSHHIQTKSSNTRAKAKEEADQIKKALQLIMMLDGLKVQIPNDMIKETATSSMTRAVYLAAVDLTSDQKSSAVDLTNEQKSSATDLTNEELIAKDSSRKLLQALKNHLPIPNQETAAINEEEKARHAINFLLHCLVAETKELILSDRRYIAEFGEVRSLKTWQEGTERSGFSTQDVMSVSCKRESTVPTDGVYSLMGILGVRFPTFPAEGYSRALSRLLDEILITHNDVSVFNWTGMEMGSPIRGRSMYPSFHKAFSKEDRGQRYNLLLYEAVQSKMGEVMVIYHGVIYMLREVINFVKDKDLKNFPLNWIQKLVDVIRGARFEDLDPELSNVSKIIGYILQNCGNPIPTSVEVKDTTEKVATAPSSETSSTSRFDLRTSLPGIIRSAETNDLDNSSKKGSKLSRLSRGIKPPLGGRNSGSAEKGSQAVSDTPDEKPKSSSNPPWEAFNSDVIKHIDGMARPTEEKEKDPSHLLPPALQEVKFDLPKPEIANPAVQKLGRDSMISPNPIIVNNSGIESIFDIQRIIVTMIDPGTLRSKIAKAISPHEKISGWCSISTGFARVVTSFSCEKHILEKELDVVETVEKKVLGEEDETKGGKRESVILKGLSIGAVTREENDVTPPDNTKPAHGKTGEDAKESKTKEAEDKEKGGAEQTEEELLVSKMIDFIQEPQLQLVADEWVLMRFSSVPGAKWFLCYLELGSTHQFYGHRIATGAIDFHNSTPEPGLVNAWKTYMYRKKSKMCSILDKYLKSKEKAGKGEEKLKEGSEFAKRGIEMAMKVDLGPKSPKSPAMDKEEKGPEDDDNEDSDDESFVDKMLDGKKMGEMFDEGKLAIRALGEYTVLAVVEKFFEMRADHLDRNLSVSVLKRTPKSLRTAVENMNDNWNLLPAMFHASIRVHMF